jgi:hypothetical protein
MTPLFLGLEKWAQPSDSDWKTPPCEVQRMVLPLLSYLVTALILHVTSSQSLITQLQSTCVLYNTNMLAIIRSNLIALNSI